MYSRSGLLALAVAEGAGAMCGGKGTLTGVAVGSAGSALVWEGSVLFTRTYPVHSAAGAWITTSGWSSSSWMWPTWCLSLQERRKRCSQHLRLAGRIYGVKYGHTGWRNPPILACGFDTPLCTQVGGMGIYLQDQWKSLLFKPGITVCYCWLWGHIFMIVQSHYLPFLWGIYHRGFLTCIIHWCNEDRSKYS